MINNFEGNILPKGWVKQFLTRDKNGITGHLDEVFPECAQDVFAYEKVKHEEKGYWSSWWAGEIRGNWMEGLVRLALLSNDKNLLEKAQKLVRDIIDSQSEGGYIGIYQEGSRYIVTKRFGELWTQSRALRTLLCYFKYTKDQTILNSIIKMADNILDNVKGSVFEKPDEDGSKGHSLMIIDGLYELYNITKDKRYADFCEKLFLDYSNHHCQFIENDMRFENLFNEKIPFIGHGPHTCESLRLPLLIYNMTKNEKYLEAFKLAENKLKKNLVLSGSCKSDEFIGTYQASLVMENDERTNIFGGSIPLPSSAYEYCSTVEIMYDYIYAEQILDDLEYADKLEWIVYNSGLASKHESHKMIQYLGQDNMYDASKIVNPRFDYSCTHDDAAGCCVANSARMMPSFVENCFIQKDKYLVANLYMPCKFTFNGMGIYEQTNYPFDYKISFNFKGKGSINFGIRIPKYAKKLVIKKNNKKVSYEVNDQLLTFSDKVSSNDKIDVEFIPEVKLIKANDGTFAISYGTLLFSKDIKSKEVVTRKYPLKGFKDCDIIPVEHENLDYTILVKGNKLLKYNIEKDNTEYILSKANIKIIVKVLDRYAYPKDLEFVPIANTILRRTTFPIMENKDNIYKLED